MKPRHEPFAKNIHDQTGRAGGLCPKCREKVPPRPGFRPSALRCPKCGTALAKP